jgi:hypothetical protein
MSSSELNPLALQDDQLCKGVVDPDISEKPTNQELRPSVLKRAPRRYRPCDIIMEKLILELHGVRRSSPQGSLSWRARSRCCASWQSIS